LAECAALPDGLDDRDLTADLDSARAVLGGLARFVDLDS
jgi:hypothetical protein